MNNKTLHILIAQQVKNIMDDKGITGYQLMQKGINQSVIEAVLQKKDKSYTLKTLKKVLDEIGVKSLKMDFEDGSVVISC